MVKEFDVGGFFWPETNPQDQVAVRATIHMAIPASLYYKYITILYYLAVSTTNPRVFRTLNPKP